MPHTVEISDESLTVTKEDLSVIIDENFKQTYVGYKKDDEAEEKLFESIRFPLYEVPGFEDSIVLENEVFSFFRTRTIVQLDSVTLNEIYDGRLADTFVETFSSSILLSETFVVDFNPAKQNSSDEGVSILEDFSFLHNPAKQRASSEGVLINEVFSKELIGVIVKTSDEGVLISEVFESSVVSTIRKFTSDSINVNEVFSKALDPSQPQDLTAEDSGSFGRVNLAWLLDSDPDRFELQISVNSSSYSTVDSDILGSERTYLHDGCGSWYISTDTIRYRLRAFNSNIASSWTLSNSLIPASCELV